MTTSEPLKEYHRTVNMPQLREEAAQLLEALANDIRDERMNDAMLEKLLLDLGSRPRANRLWLWLRGLQSALKD